MSYPLLEDICSNQASVGGASRRFDLDSQIAEAARRLLRHRLDLGERAHQDGRGHLFQVAASDGRVGVARKDHLALLSDLEMARDRTWSLSANRAIGRAATATQGAAATGEQGQPHAAPGRPANQIRLSLVKGKARGD